jgi:glycosyltransferase involved in cell wall biosynthesis
MKKNNRFILLEGCDFINFPKGGQLTFAKRMMKLYGNEMLLVGTTDNPNIPIGEWIKITIDNVEYDYFAFRKVNDFKKKPKIPARISDLLSIIKYRKKIFSKEIYNVFMQAPELIIATHNWNWSSICYRFAGVENPLSNSRYSWGIYLAKLFEKKLFSALNKANVILASADDEAIDSLVSRSDNKLKRKNIIKFPTRVDTDFFYPMNKELVQKELKIENNTNINLVFCGRLNVAKGWDFILDVFSIFKERNPNSQLIYVGDGEDRKKLEQKIIKLKLQNYVTITGFQPLEKVRLYTNLADVVLIGSKIEGWSISMVETLACGKPMVSTKVSGARDLITDSVNGYVVNKRDPEIYCSYVEKALQIKDVEKKSLEFIQKYTLSTMKKDIDNLWERN